MKDVMLDLETLGTRHDAMIIAIGAVYFDRETGEVGRGFSAIINPGILGDKFTVDYDTIKWWFEQSDRARDLVMGRSLTPLNLHEALNALNLFLRNECEYLWSHATFDMPILMNSYDVVGKDFPVPFRNIRDLRTLMDLYGKKVEIEREGTHHHALDDAKYQARYASIALQKFSHGTT